MVNEPNDGPGPDEEPWDGAGPPDADAESGRAPSSSADGHGAGPADTGTETGGHDAAGQQSEESMSGRTKGHDEQFCGSCGEVIKKEAEICPHCGVRVKGSRRRSTTSSATGSGEKDEAVAALISFFIPGGGQIYNEQMGRGIGILVSYIAFWIITIVLMFVLIGFLLMFLAPLFHVGAAWDAYTQAEKINRGEVQV